MKKTLIIFFILLVGTCKKEAEGADNLKQRAKAGDPKAQEELIQILKQDRQSQKRRFAAETVGELNIQQANTQLLTSFDTDDDNVREAVIYSIGRLAKPENLRLVESVWKNPKEKRSISLAALKGIGNFRSKEAVTVLKDAFKEKDNQVQMTAIYGLGDTDSPEAADELLKILNGIKQKSEEHSSGLEKAAAYSLTRLKQASSYDSILQYLEKKIYNYEYDEVFESLATLLASEKFTKAEKVFAQAYLSSPSSSYKFKKILLKSFADFKIQTSYCVITGSVLNIRAKPNDRAEVIGSISAGQLATVLEKTEISYMIENNEDYWYKIETPAKKQGWVFGYYLKFLDHNNLPKVEEEKK